MAGEASWHPHKYSRKRGDQFTKKREELAIVNSPMPAHGKLRGGPPTPHAVSEEEAEEVALMLQPGELSWLFRECQCPLIRSAHPVSAFTFLLSPMTP